MYRSVTAPNKGWRKAAHVEPSDTFLAPISASEKFNISWSFVSTQRLYSKDRMSHRSRVVVSDGSRQRSHWAATAFKADLLSG